MTIHGRRLSVDPWIGRLPRGAPTGVGSLPLADPEEAVALVSRHCPEIPFWPQLPGRADAEGMLRQFLAPAAPFLVGRRGVRLVVGEGRLASFLDALQASDGSVDEAHAAGLHALLSARARGAFPAAIAYKGHLTGPLTLAFCLEHRQRSVVCDSAAVQVIADYTARAAGWQARILTTAGAPALIVVDEPCLALVDTLHNDQLARHLSAVLDAIRVAGGRAGIHCCAPASPALLAGLRPDLISFDANTALERFLAEPAIHAFVDRGGWLATGLVPTTSDLPDQLDGHLFARWLLAASDCCDPAKLARQTLITASCGLGLVPESAAVRSFEVTRALALRITRVGGDPDDDIGKTEGRGHSEVRPDTR